MMMLTFDQAHMRQEELLREAAHERLVDEARSAHRPMLAEITRSTDMPQSPSKSLRAIIFRALTNGPQFAWRTFV